MLGAGKQAGRPSQRDLQDNSVNTLFLLEHFAIEGTFCVQVVSKGKWIFHVKYVYHQVDEYGYPVSLGIVSHLKVTEGFYLEIVGSVSIQNCVVHYFFCGHV